MPKTVNLPHDVPNNDGYTPSAGVSITWTPTASRLDISGWYDGCCHITGATMTLYEFFVMLGIDQKICFAAFKENNR